MVTDKKKHGSIGSLTRAVWALTYSDARFELQERLRFSQLPADNGNVGSLQALVSLLDVELDGLPFF